MSNALSRIMRKPDFRICKNKGTDQLCSNHAADQCLCFRLIDSTITLLPNPKFKPLASVTVQPGLCWTWSETHEDRFSHNAVPFTFSTLLRS